LEWRLVERMHRKTLRRVRSFMMADDGEHTLDMDFKERFGEIFSV
jgi:hypothetical protein